MKNSFKDWKAAARQYAADHPELDMWEFQVEAMASDFAWRMEGCNITPESVEYAYQDWISGNNPYSVHTIGLRHEDGYDYPEWVRRKKATAEEEHRQYGLDHGIEPENLDRYIRGVHPELYFDKNKAVRATREWFSGEMKESPHHIPREPEHIKAREERLEAIKSMFPKVVGGLLWDLSPSIRSLCPTPGYHRFYELHYVQGISLEDLRESEFE